MDLIRISDSKLKIMLTSTDMSHYNLHTDSISIADQHVRQVLQKLLADAKAQTGFDGFFTDEPQISRNGIPWSFIMPEEYQKAYNDIFSISKQKLIKNKTNQQWIK